VRKSSTREDNTLWGVIGTDQWGQQETVTCNRQVRSCDGRVLSRIVWVLFAATLGIGCSPRVKVEAPDKPIEINVNIKIEHELRIKLDKAVEQTLEEHPELFGTETRP